MKKRKYRWWSRWPTLKETHEALAPFGCDRITTGIAILRDGGGPRTLDFGESWVPSKAGQYAREKRKKQPAVVKRRREREQERERVEAKAQKARERYYAKRDAHRAERERADAEYRQVWLAEQKAWEDANLATMMRTTQELLEKTAWRAEQIKYADLATSMCRCWPVKWGYSWKTPDL